MKCTWRHLLLVLVLLSCDGGSYGSIQNYYVGCEQSLVENLNEATDNPKLATDMSFDTGRKRVNISAVSSNARKLRSVGNGFRYFHSLSPTNVLVRFGTDEKRPPNDVRQRVNAKREITPTYSISSDKYSVNVSYHLAFKRSCGLPDAAFIFKQIPCEEETTTEPPGTGDFMELLTFHESSSCETSTAAEFAHRKAKDKHRVISVDDDASKFIVKDALAFESSQVTKIWGEHGRAGPVVAGGAVPSLSEIQQTKNLRKRRSPHWSFPYSKQVLLETERLITKCKALSKAAKIGQYFGKNETDNSNGTNVVGEGKKCSSQNKITPYPHKGHWCHYHRKVHHDRKSILFRPTKTATVHSTSKMCVTNQIKSKEESTMTTKRIGAVTTKTKNLSLVGGVESTQREKADSSHSKKAEKHEEEKVKET